MRKKARVLTIPQDRSLTRKEAKRLIDHAYNSSLWYATTYYRNSNHIRERLYAKGYPKDSIKIEDSPTPKSFNIVEETVKKLVENEIINDTEYANNLIESQTSQGKSITAIKQKMYQRKIPTSIINETIREYENSAESIENNLENLEKAAYKIIKLSSYKKLTETHAKKQKLTQSLINKGFDYQDISDFLERTNILVD